MIVEVTGLSAANRSGQAVRIEAAMKRALDETLASGERRPHILKKRMMAARADEQRKMGLPVEAVRLDKIADEKQVIDAVDVAPLDEVVKGQ